MGRDEGMSLVPEPVTNLLRARLKRLSGRRKTDLIPPQISQETVMCDSRAIFDQRIAVGHAARDGHHDTNTTYRSAQKLGSVGNAVSYLDSFKTGFSRERSCFGTIPISALGIQKRYRQVYTNSV